MLKGRNDTMSTKTVVSKSEMVCLICQKKGLPIHRTRSRERGHVKDLSCYTCRNITPHLELRGNTSDEWEFKMNPREFVKRYALKNIRDPEMARKVRESYDLKKENA